MVYEVLKALHIISVIAWMAGLLYLPRLFVYHARTPPGSAQSEIPQGDGVAALQGHHAAAVMATWLFGLVSMLTGDWSGASWLHVKLTAVVILSLLHGLFGH